MTNVEANWKYHVNIPEVLKAEEIGNPEKWEKEGRKRLKDILLREEYGMFPEYDSKNTAFNVVAEENVLMIPALRRQVDITVNNNEKSFTFSAYMFLPKGKTNVPVFLHICRHEWMSRSVARGIIDQSFPLAEIIERGYGVIYYDTDEVAQEDYTAGIIDHEEGYKYEGYKNGLFETLKIDTDRQDDLGAIGLWAFAAMRVMDYLETVQEVDASKVMVMGHSRLGKTALLAGAMDDRFAITISNSSGAGGAALFKIKGGEHVDYMVETIPYWFCQNYKKYVDKEDEMEFDQHYLLSLIAPRYLYIQSSELDDWADPVAEFSSAVLASEVYEKVYQKPGLIENGFPKVDTPLLEGNIGYHVRTGDHNLFKFDWHAFMDFADKKLISRSPEH